PSWSIMPLMPSLSWLLLVTGGYPLWRAWQGNRETALLQAINWAIIAWAAWLWALFPGRVWPEAAEVRYLALSLTGCAMVAVLGARRPGVGAWNFVVLGLLAILLVPLAESLITGRSLRPGPARLVFLGGTVAVGILNYLPTRSALGAVLLGAGCAGEMRLFAGSAFPLPGVEEMDSLGQWLLGLALWGAYVRSRWRPAPPAEFDQLWLSFRDRFGLFWGQRLREQFNRSAAHAGWPVFLRWQGLRLTGPRPGPAEQTAMVGVLRALLKRFGPPDSPGPVARGSV
ncbi:MAG: hypothetical protein JO112_09765, partial [Planctomycetes bacterium]|nr:hypothetical protein [Planctomycetota bacterium]